MKVFWPTYFGVSLVISKVFWRLLWFCFTSHWNYFWGLGGKRDKGSYKRRKARLIYCHINGGQLLSKLGLEYFIFSTNTSNTLGEKTLFNNIESHSQWRKKGTWLEIKLHSSYLMEKIIIRTKVLGIFDRPHLLYIWHFNIL